MRLYLVTVNGRAHAFGNGPGAVRAAQQLQDTGARVTVRRKRKPRWKFYHGKRG